MPELLHALVLQQRRERELKEKNVNAKRRLQEIGANYGQHIHINDLKNVTKVAESILNAKDLKDEFEEVLNRLDVMNVKLLNQSRDEILRKYDNDPYFVRLFTKYTELLGTEVKKSTIQTLERKQQTPVKFFDGN
jgi:YesN/AraC family two-component response regulator